LTALAATAAPSIAGPLLRKQRFTLQRKFVPPGAEVTALADSADRIIYGVRTLVTAVHRIADDCFVWSVEYDAADEPFHIGDVVCGRVCVAEAAIPDDIAAWARNRWQKRDLPWQQRSSSSGRTTRFRTGPCSRGPRITRGVRGSIIASMPSLKSSQTCIMTLIANAKR